MSYKKDAEKIHLNFYL